MRRYTKVAGPFYYKLMHQRHHRAYHRMLIALVADYFVYTAKSTPQDSIASLVEWSMLQAKRIDHWPKD